MNNTDSKYSAIIPAAGCSSRMGSSKPLLPFGRGTVLGNQIALLKSVGVSTPVVVTGFHARELTPAAENLGAGVVINENYKDGMFSSVAAGLEAVDSIASAFFILPVDIPLVTGDTLLKLIRAFEAGDAKIIYPVYKGHRGHPPLISSNLIPEILAHDGRGGLRTVLERHDDRSENIIVENEGILLDMDTPEAYEDVLRRWEQRQIPSIDCCLRLLNEYKTPESVVLHSLKVSELALYISRNLNKHGCSLSVLLAERAGLLHDIAKGLPNHDIEGAKLLQLLGYDDIAEICAKHMVLEYPDGAALTEAEVLFLSDKLLDGTVVRTLSERKTEALSIKGQPPVVCDSIIRRFSSADRILAKVDHILGYKLFEQLKN